MNFRVSKEMLRRRALKLIEASVHRWLLRRSLQRMERKATSQLHFFNFFQLSSFLFIIIYKYVNRISLWFNMCVHVCVFHV